MITIEVLMVFLMVLGVFVDVSACIYIQTSYALSGSHDPVYALLRQSASDKFPYITYVFGNSMALS